MVSRRSAARRRATLLSRTRPSIGSLPVLRARCIAIAIATTPLLRLRFFVFCSPSVKYTLILLLIWTPPCFRFFFFFLFGFALDPGCFSLIPFLLPFPPLLPPPWRTRAFTVKWMCSRREWFRAGERKMDETNKQKQRQGKRGKKNKAKHTQVSFVANLADAPPRLSVFLPSLSFFFLSFLACT